MNITIDIQPNILQVVEKLTQFEETLKFALTIAGMESGDLVISVAQGKMDFKNPTGQFKNSLQNSPLDAYTEQIYSDLPYGNRLEWGFMGTDSLGRYYDEEGMHFMMFTIEDPTLTGAVAMKYITAVAMTWGSIVQSMGGSANALAL